MEKLLSSIDLENEYITLALLGDYSFLDKVNDYDLSVIFNDVERLQYREDVVEALYQAFHEKNPFFTFLLVYKMEKYKDFVCYFLFHNNLQPLTLEQCVLQFLKTSQSWIYPFFAEKVGEISLLGEPGICYLLETAFHLHDFDTIHKLVCSNDIKVRSTCLSYVFESSLRSSVSQIYPGDITTYFVIQDTNGNILEKIPEEILSSCATNLFDYHFNEKLYMQMMHFILEHYGENHLLSYLLNGIQESDFDHRKEFLEENVSLLYDSSSDAQLILYERFPHLLDEGRTSVIESFLSIVDASTMEFIASSFATGLGNTILRFFTKYNALAATPVRRFFKRGTCSCTFQIGEYLLKISDGKYSIFDPICPINFLIIKNLDECFIRKGSLVVGAVEVQKWCPVEVKLSDKEIIRQFTEEVTRQGLIFLDVFNNKDTNVHLLNDYHDADCDDPESLPAWFKKWPAVLIDHDLVYPASYFRRLKELEEYPFGIANERFPGWDAFSLSKKN